MNKYQRDPFIKINIGVPIHMIQEEYLRIKQIACDTKDDFQGRGCAILDLTYVDPLKIDINQQAPFAGTSTERAVSHFLPDLRKKNNLKRLQVAKQKNPLADDCNHNTIKKQYEDSKLFSWIESIAPFAKVTFSTLHARSWWPSHYDFSSGHAFKVNIPVFTNDEAVSLSWNQREKALKKIYMKDWWLQSAFKHTAFNWGETERTFLLITFPANLKLRKLVDADL